MSHDFDWGAPLAVAYHLLSSLRPCGFPFHASRRSAASFIQSHAAWRICSRVPMVMRTRPSQPGSLERSRTSTPAARIRRTNSACCAPISISTKFAWLGQRRTLAASSAASNSARAASTSSTYQSRYSDLQAPAASRPTPANSRCRAKARAASSASAPPARQASQGAGRPARRPSRRCAQRTDSAPRRPNPSPSRRRSGSRLHRPAELREARDVQSPGVARAWQRSRKGCWDWRWR